MMNLHSRSLPSRRRTRPGFPFLVAGILALLTSAADAAVSKITPAQLQEGREKKTINLIIDLRTNTDYERGHIPGAINIPHFVIEERSVPPAGTVAVYGDGLGTIDEAAIANAIAQKPGVNPVLLAGGLAAWESAGLPTTHVKGLTEAHVPFITYEQLEKAQSRGVVLADLRSHEPQRVATSENSESASKTDLRTAFPAARVLEANSGRVAQSTDAGGASASGRAAVMRQLATVDAAEELIVLVDDGDGSAEETLFRLRAGGNKRVVVLAGGERILEREGRSGLKRVGYGISESSADGIQLFGNEEATLP